MNARRDVAEVIRQWLLKAPEDCVNAGVGVAAASRNVTAFAARFLVGGVGNGRANGISVRVLVSNNVGRRDGCAQRKVVDDRRDAGGRHEGGATWTALPGGGSGK